jgi:hypothetical protein
MSVIPALRVRQEDQVFEDNLGYIVSSEAPWAT